MSGHIDNRDVVLQNQRNQEKERQEQEGRLTKRATRARIPCCELQGRDVNKDEVLGDWA